MASSTLDISKVPSMEDNEKAGLQTLTVRKSDFYLTGVNTEKRSPSGVSNPSQTMVTVE